MPRAAEGPGDRGKGLSQECLVLSLAAALYALETKKAWIRMIDTKKAVASSEQFLIKILCKLLCKILCKKLRQGGKKSTGEAV